MSAARIADFAVVTPQRRYPPWSSKPPVMRSRLYPPGFAVGAFPESRKPYLRDAQRALSLVRVAQRAWQWREAVRRVLWVASATPSVPVVAYRPVGGGFSRYERKSMDAEPPDGTVFRCIMGVDEYEIGAGFMFWEGTDAASLAVDTGRGDSARNMFLVALNPLGRYEMELDDRADGDLTDLAVHETAHTVSWDHGLEFRCAEMDLRRRLRRWPLAYGRGESVGVKLFNEHKQRLRNNDKRKRTATDTRTQK